MAEEQNINVRITSTADVKGFQQAQKATADMGKATSAVTAAEKDNYRALVSTYEATQRKINIAQASGKATEGYRKQLTALDTALSSERSILIATAIEQDVVSKGKGELVKHTSIATKETLTFGNALGKAWHGLRMLAYVLPGVGIAGLIGGIVAAVAALAKLVVAFENTKQQLEDFITKQQAQLDVVLKIKTAYDAHKNAMDAIGTSAQSAEEAMRKYNDEVEKSKDEDLKKADLEKRFGMAEAGKITDPVARAKQELKVQEKFMDKSAEIKTKAEHAKVDAERQAVNKAIGDQEASKNEVAKAEVALEEAFKMREGKDKELKALEAAEIKASEKVRANAEDIPVWDVIKSAILPPLGQATQREIEREVAKAKEDAALASQSVAGQRSVNRGIDRRIDAKQRELREAEENERKAREFLAEKKKSPFATEAEAARNVGNIQGETRMEKKILRTQSEVEIAKLLEQIEKNTRKENSKQPPSFQRLPLPSNNRND
jgi:hypothetical protein